MGYDKQAYAKLSQMTGLSLAEVKRAWYEGDIKILMADNVDGDAIRRLTLNKRERLEWRLQRRGFAAHPNDPGRHRVEEILAGDTPAAEGERRGSLRPAPNGQPVPAAIQEEWRAPEKGYVYILVNPAFTNCVKIGKTTKDPETRAREISSGTGVPAPYSVVWDALVRDCHEAERVLHRELAQYRARHDREFFSLSVKRAIAEVQRLVAEMAMEAESEPDDGGES